MQKYIPLSGWQRWGWSVAYGTLDGKLYGDTLIANYQFMSEGIESVRQVAFLIKDSIATEGYGDVADKEGKMIFEDWKSLNFKNGLSLKKIDCK